MMGRAFLIGVLFATALFASCSTPSTRTRKVETPPARSDNRVNQPAPTSTFTGLVASVTDGDTIVVVDGAKRSYEIRLKGIDAPEGGQAFGDQSRQNLANLIGSEEVSVEWSKRDRYGRIVGKVSSDGRDVCLEQIKAGLAWHYKYYQSEQTPEDRTLYADAEVDARAASRGLWADSHPIPPWDFRRGR